MTQPNRTLTDADIAALAAACKDHSACNLGLTEEEAKSLKTFIREDIGMVRKFLGAWSSAESIVGRLVLTAIVLGAIGIFTKGFWVSVFSGAKAVGIGK